MALGSFLPIVMLCGIIWPIEAMSPYLTWASACLPLTQATESLRYQIFFLSNVAVLLMFI